MFSRIAIVVLSLLLSATAVAQMVAPVSLVNSQRPLFERLLSIEVASPSSGDSDQVVPLWASPDGRLLAIVALSSNAGAPALPPSPAFGGLSDFRIVDATDLFSAGLRMRLGQGLHADVTLGQISSAPLSYGLAAHSGCLPGGCWGNSRDAARPTAMTANIGLGWSPALAEGLDLSFGLSWLEGRGTQLPVLSQTAVGALPIDLSVLDVPGIGSYKLNSARRVKARGVWQLGNGSVVDLTAALGRVELSPFLSGLAASGLDLNQASLGLGVANGSVRGSIVGRVTSVDEPGIAGNRRWSGLDLGVSWRTPWRGEVTVGAQNLWSAPLDPTAPRDLDASQARTPYVQYRQDL
ncbi:MAG: hypothetical protein ABIR27_02880 [Dokdonella sp.]